MVDTQLVLEHSIEADVNPAFAWKFRTDITTWSDPPATFQLDGPFAEGSRGMTLMPGQEPLAWCIRDVRPGQSFAIEMPLDQATLLAGNNAGEYRKQVEAGFGANLAAGLAKIAQSRAVAENTGRR